MQDRSAVRIDPKRVKKAAVDIIGLVGGAGVIEGVRQVYQPAGWIVGGVFALAFAWFWARAEAVSP